MILELILCGLALSLYASWVVRSLKHKGYKPMCDINEHISCSRAFKSAEGQRLIMHNAHWGVLYYLLWLAVYFLRPALLPAFALLPVIFSFELLGVTIKQRNFCLVCTLVYLVNFTLAYLLWT